MSSKGSVKSGIRVVGLGGTLRAGSTTEQAVRDILQRASQLGAHTSMFSGAALNFPVYSPGDVDVTPEISSFISALRCADAVVIGSPAYHGGISGMIKNALDYTQEMCDDPSPYLADRAIGCVATGHGWQGTNSTLSALRAITHSLRGWPTSLGIAVNSQESLFDGEGRCVHPEVGNQFQIMAEQLIWFCQGRVRTGTQ